MTPRPEEAEAATTRADRRAEIFEQAADLAPGERDAFVRERCGADFELAAEILELLAVDSDLPPGFLPRTSGISARPGTRIGPYEVLERLGEGGMGTVYAARQAFPRRDVALKVIRPGRLSDAAQRRFQHEVQALANLQHPGIAQIYDAGTALVEEGGTTREEPYLAMELVRGRPLVEYAEEKGLGLRERLELIARVADAVHHAHQRGVIHRDLKPENVLVVDDETTVGTPDPAFGEVGQPKVLDFGIARITGEAAPTRDFETRAGELVGTLSYMSPEQIAGSNAIDGRSDVYALGVMLYRLVSGRLPHDLLDLNVPQAIDRLRGDEPVPLGKLSSELRGDVATIAVRALEKDRDRRYASAAELAADLRRHLRGEPIHARSDSSFYRLHRSLRRHRAGLVTTLVAAIVLAAFAVVFVQLSRKQEVLASSAEAGFDGAMNAIEALISASEERLAKAPENTPARRGLLEEAQRVYTSLRDHESDDPNRSLRLAKAFVRVGYIQYHVGDVEGSMVSHREALEELDTSAAHGLDSPNHRAQALAYLGQASHRAGDAAAAERYYREAVATTRAELDGSPEDAGVAENYASALKYLARIDRDTGRAQASEEGLREGIALLEDVLVREPEHAEARRSLASLREDYGNQLVGELRWEEADEQLALALEMAEALFEEDDATANLHALVGIGLNFGQVLYETGHEAEAIALYDVTTERGEQLSARDPGSTIFRSSLAQAYSNLGAIHGWRDDVPETERCITRARELTLQLVAEAPDVLPYRIKLGSVNTNLGALYVFQGEHERALEVLTEARVEYERAMAVYPQRLDWKRTYVSVLRNLGLAYLGLGRHADAIEIVRTAPGAREARNVGRFLSLVSRSMDQVYADESVDFAEREELGREYVRDAIEYMERTLDAGLPDRHFPNEGSLNTLLEDPEFEGFLDYVEVTFDPERG